MGNYGHKISLHRNATSDHPKRSPLIRKHQDGYNSKLRKPFFPALEKQRQVDLCEFPDSHSYMERPVFNKKKKKKF